MAAALKTPAQSQNSPNTHETLPAMLKDAAWLSSLRIQTRLNKLGAIFVSNLASRPSISCHLS